MPAYLGCLFDVLPWLTLFCLIGNGNCKDTRGLKVAIRQRVDDALTLKLPMPYLVNRSHTYLVNAAHPVQTDFKQTSLSLNWSLSDISLEVVDGLDGITTERLEFFFIMLEVMVSLIVLCQFIGVFIFLSYAWKPQHYPNERGSLLC